MSYQFRAASSVNEPTPLLVGIAGGTGSGKTFSAFRLARGIVGPQGKIAMLDTEKRRSLHYRKDFEFDFAEIAPPFTPEAYQGAIEAAEKARYDCIIIDSTSHVWAGDGGCLDIHEEVVQRIAKGDWKKAERVSALAWSEPKQRYKRMITRALQSRAHIIYCLRAEQKLKAMKVTEDGKEVTKFVDAGWVPIIEKHFMFEMTCSFMMLPDQVGVPQPIKLPETMKRFFPEGERLGEKQGEMLAQWSQDPHFGLTNVGRATKDAPAPKEGTAGRLQLFAPDGAVSGNYASITTWLTAFEKAVNDADAGESAGRLWDLNQDMYYALQGKAQAANNAAVIDRFTAIGKIIFAKLNPGAADPGAQGDMLEGAR